MRSFSKGILLALLAVTFWSTVATAFKIALRGMTPFQLLIVSVYTSWALLLIAVLRRGIVKTFRGLTPAELTRHAFLGALNPYLYYQMLFFAYDRLPAQSAQVLNFTWPVMIVLLSWILGHEKISLKQTGALGLSFLGTFIVVGGFGSGGAEPLDAAGAILAFASSFVWAFFWIFNKRSSLDPTVSLFLCFSAAAVFLTLQALFTGTFILPPLSALPAAVYVGIFEMSLTFILWLSALKAAVNTPMVNNLMYLSPFLSLLIINRVLGEAIRLHTAAGLVLIIAGILGQWLAGRTADREIQT